MAKFVLPSRQIHLDFHTGPDIADVGVDFDARDFARTIKRASVNSLTVFAKCHHGHLYYNTNRPERHPGLRKGLNLLGEQIEALHREDIRAPIYISLQCDEYAANNWPQWVARELDGRPVGAGPLAPGWQILDMSSPYQDYAAEQIAEILRLFKPVDGIFFDMCWDQPSLNAYFVEAMLRENLNPELESDRVLYANRLAHQYMKRFHQMVKSSSREASVYFNGRGYNNLAAELQYQTQVEIEALPTGGWGYMYFPKHVRYARTFDRPYMGMTARFHKSWADFGGLKPAAALEYETSQMLAHGAKCSIGDQLHPRGVLDPAAYELIGAVYARVAEREPWCLDATPVSQIGLFQNFRKTVGIGGTMNSATAADEGAVRVLTQLKHQFDIVSEVSDLGRYDLLILPDAVQMSESLVTKLRAYMKRGGALIATGVSGLSDGGAELRLPELNIKPLGFSPFTTTYIRFGRRIGDDVPATDHVMYERGIRVTPGRGAIALAQVVEPYFERGWRRFSSHFQTPPDKPTPFAAATLAGRAAYIAYPLFSAIAQHGNYPYRLLLRNIIELLLPEPLLRLDAPTGTEATVMRQKNRTIVHLLHYSPERRTPNLDIIEDVVPLFDRPLSLKLPKPPRRVYLAPQQTDVPFEYLAGRVNLRVPVIDGHAMVVFE